MKARPGYGPHIKRENGAYWLVDDDHDYRCKLTLTINRRLCKESADISFVEDLVNKHGPKEVPFGED